MGSLYRSAGEASGRSGCWQERGFVALCCVVAFLLRCVTSRDLIGPHGEHLFLDPDSYDHLRRITLGLLKFPHIPSYDSYYGFPAGTGQIWSPLFDYLLSAVLFLTRSGKDACEAVGFWLSPVLATVTVFMVYRMGRRMFGARAGCIAALVIAILPGHMLYTFAGILDHHASEPLLCMLLLGAVIDGFGPEGGKRASIRCAFWIVFSILIWRGSVIFWGVAGAVLLIQARIDVERHDVPSAAAVHGVRSALLAAVLLAPICASNLWGSSATVSFSTVSWFHVILLLLCAALCCLTGQVIRRPLVRRAVVVGALFLLAPVIPSVLTEVWGGISVIGGTDPWLDSINELRSTLFPEGKFTLSYVAVFMSGFFFLQPLVLFLVYRQWRNEGKGNHAYLAFVVWGLLFFFLPLFRERYMHLASVTTALGAGYLGSMLALLGGSRHREWVGALAGGMACVALIIPSAPFLKDPRQEVQLPVEEKYDLREALDWLKEKTPKTSWFLDPAQLPEYGVLSYWDTGAMITYLAERPTVATNFGWETHGLYESCAFLSLSNPAAAEMLVRQNRVRYILLSDHAKELKVMWSVARQGIQSRKLGLAMMTPFDPYQSMFYRLYVGNGSMDTPRMQTDGALERYRLVYESKNRHWNPDIGEVPSYKIFEHVEGAVVSGTTRPGDTVDIRLELRAPQNRTVIYHDRSKADRTGNFRFTVPYSTDGHLGELVPERAYEVSAQGKVVHVAVTEDQVLSGKTVRVN